MTWLMRDQEISSCVHRLTLRRSTEFSGDLRDTSPEVQRRIREARAWRQEVIRSLSASESDVVRPTNESETLSALARGARYIIQPQLPIDPLGHRTSAPHVLVLAERYENRFLYSPLFIRNAEVVVANASRQLAHSDLQSLDPSQPEIRIGVAPRPSVTAHGLALVHSLEVLLALGHADPLWRGALVDRRGDAWWFSLLGDEFPRFNREAYLEHYRERAAVLDAYENWRREGGEFPTRPRWHRACDSCEFASRCRTELEQRDDVSLVRFTDFSQQQLLRSYGVTTRTQLAALDPKKVVSARDEPGLVRRRAAGPEEMLSPELDKLDELIYRARVSIDGTYMLIGPAADVHCPTADVEVDIDMESYNDVTYLWGAAVRHSPIVTGVEAGYRAFVSFESLTSEIEAKVFSEFWSWFSGLRTQVLAQGLTFAAYCFWAHAEESAMNRAVDFQTEDGPTRQDIDEFRRGSPSQWIDIYAVFKDQIQTDGPLGLKVVAGKAGFSWRDEAPGGEASMVWYEAAVSDDPGIAVAARTRLLAYNEDDCLATRFLRDWLNTEARTLPSRDAPR